MRYGLFCLSILDLTLVTLHILCQAYKALCDEYHRWVLGVAPFDSSKEQPSSASVYSANTGPSPQHSEPTAADASSLDADSINKKPGDTEFKNICRYIRFKFNKYQSLRIGCIRL